MTGIYNNSRTPVRGRGRVGSLQRPVPTQAARISPSLEARAIPPQQPQPEISYQEFQLKSCAKRGKNHLMEFIDKKQVDMDNFTRPIKMHRKDSQTRLIQGLNNATNAAGSSAAVMAQVQHGPKSSADTSLIAPMGGATRNKQMLFKKRTKQIFLAKEDTRELKEQEQKPWILEDYDGQHSFTGTFEGGQNADYVFFVVKVRLVYTLLHTSLTLVRVFFCSPETSKLSL